MCVSTSRKQVKERMEDRESDFSVTTPLFRSSASRVSDQSRVSLSLSCNSRVATLLFVPLFFLSVSSCLPILLCLPDSAESLASPKSSTTAWTLGPYRLPTYLSFCWAVSLSVAFYLFLSLCLPVFVFLRLCVFFS